MCYSTLSPSVFLPPFTIQSPLLKGKGSLVKISKLPIYNDEGYQTTERWCTLLQIRKDGPFIDKSFSLLKKEPYLTGMAKSHCSKSISMKVHCWNLSVAEWNLLWCIQAKNVIDVTREGVGHMSMSCEIWDFNVKRGKGISRTFWTMGSTPI